MFCFFLLLCKALCAAFHVMKGALQIKFIIIIWRDKKTIYIFLMFEHFGVLILSDFNHRNPRVSHATQAC